MINEKIGRIMEFGTLIIRYGEIGTQFVVLGHLLCGNRQGGTHSIVWGVNYTVFEKMGHNLSFGVNTDLALLR